jgi:hypothetical protein
MAVVVEKRRAMHFCDRGDQQIHRGRTPMLRSGCESGLRLLCGDLDVFVDRQMRKGAEIAGQELVVSSVPGREQEL